MKLVQSLSQGLSASAPPAAVRLSSTYKAINYSRFCQFHVKIISFLGGVGECTGTVQGSVGSGRAGSDAGGKKKSNRRSNVHWPAEKAAQLHSRAHS